MKQLLTIFVTIMIIVMTYFQKETFIHWIEAGGHIAIFFSILLVALLVFFPVIPFAVVAAMIGSVFGLWFGSMFSLCGILIGTMTMFLMARFGFQKWVQNMLGKYSKFKEYAGYFEKNAFIGILFFRVVPVIPSPILNVLCGVSVVRWHTFLLASLIGKIPGVILFTVAGRMLGENKLVSIFIYVIYFLIISVFTTIFLNKRKVQASE